MSDAYDELAGLLGLENPNGHDLIVAAKAEIERLRERYEFQIEVNRSLVEACGKAMDLKDAAKAEIERLPKEVARLHVTCRNRATEIERLQAHLRLIRNIAANNTVLHPPSIVAHIDRVLAGKPADAPEKK